MLNITAVGGQCRIMNCHSIELKQPKNGAGLTAQDVVFYDENGRRLFTATATPNRDNDPIDVHLGGSFTVSGREASWVLTKVSPDEAAGD